MNATSRVLLLALVLAVAASAAGYFAWSALFARAPSDEVSALPPLAVAEDMPPGAPRPPFSLPDLEGTPRSVTEWDGKVLVVNFWATWCPPCRKEIPSFIELQAQYGAQGLQFVGIAVDNRDAVQEYADALGVNYPMLVGELDAIEVGKQYGNRLGALPYTVVVDRQGKMVFFKRGELSRGAAERVILSLL